MKWLPLCLWFVVSAAYASPPSPPSIINCVPKVQAGPLSQGLAFLWTSIGGLQYDLIRHSYGSGPTAGPIPGPYGSQTLFSTAGAGFISTANYNLTDNGVGTGGMTLFALTNVPSSATKGFIVYFGNTFEAALVANNTTLQPGNGRISIETTDATTFRGAVTPQILDGNWHMIISTVPNTGPANWTIYFDGVSQSLFTTGSGSYTTLADVDVGVGSFHNPVNTPLGGSMVVAGQYDRILSVSEIAALSLNPMALLTCN